jgi:Rps23 Pro-64 3,4-dihydroxylase Tpa1-like proline 4-hydroxylase
MAQLVGFRYFSTHYLLDPMDTPTYYFPENLCRDLQDLIELNPSNPDEKNAWMAKAESIRKRLDCFLDLNRSSFTYALHFIQHGDFMSRHADSYETGKRKIQTLIREHQSGRLPY